MFDGMLKEEARNLQEVMEALEQKNKVYSGEIQNLKSRQSTDQAEIGCLTGIWNTLLEFTSSLSLKLFSSFRC